MFCRNCGNQLNDGQKFCTVCGTPAGELAKSQEAPKQQPQPEQPEQTYQPEQQFQTYQANPQPQFTPHIQNYKTLGGYLLVITILVFVSCVSSLGTAISNISSVVDIAKYYHISNGVGTLMAALFVTIAVSFVLVVGMAATGAMIIMKKKSAIYIYALAKIIDIVGTIIAIILLGVAVRQLNYFSFKDVFGPVSWGTLFINIGFFIANMIYFKKSERVKEYFGKEESGKEQQILEK